MHINESITRIIISFAIIGLVAIISIFLSRKSSKKFPDYNFKLPFLLLSIGLCSKLFLHINLINAYHGHLNTILYTIIFFSIVKILDQLIKGKQKKSPATKVKIPKLIHDIILGLIYFVVFFSIMKMELGIDLAPILTTSAVVSMVLGLALQDTLTNFIAGVIIHIEKPFNLHNWVLISDVEGKVMEINWRTTKVLTFDNDFLVVTNSSILKNAIINYSYPTSNHVMIVNIGTSYSDPPNKVKEVILQTAGHTEYVLKNPKPSVRLIKYNDFSIDYEIRLWINNFAKKKIIENELLTSIWYAFERENIKIPFPVKEVYIRKDSDEQFADSKSDNEKHDCLELIRSVDFFADLDLEILQEISGIFQQKRYGKGEVLFEEGEEGDSFFIIRKGKVKVSFNNRKIAELHDGDFFGEMSLLTGKKRNATIKALEDSEFIIITKDSFSNILMKDIKIAERISKILADRKKADVRFETLAKKEKMIKSFVPRKESEDEKTILDKMKDFFNIE